MSRASREKGKRGEREVADVFRRAGFKDAHRSGQMQANGLGTNADLGGLPPEIHAEVKRDEKMSVDAMVRQAERDKKPGQQSLVAWRRNGGRWRADVDLEWLARVLSHLYVTPMSRSGVGDCHAPIQKTEDRELKLLGETADEGGV